MRKKKIEAILAVFFSFSAANLMQYFPFSETVIIAKATIFFLWYFNEWCNFAINDIGVYTWQQKYYINYFGHICDVIEHLLTVRKVYLELPENPKITLIAVISLLFDIKQCSCYLLPCFHIIRNL